SAISSVHLSTELGWGGGEQQALSLIEGLRARAQPAVLVASPRSALFRRAAERGLEPVGLHAWNEADPQAVVGLPLPPPPPPPPPPARPRARPARPAGGARRGPPERVLDLPPLRAGAQPAQVPLGSEALHRGVAGGGGPPRPRRRPARPHRGGAER